MGVPSIVHNLPGFFFMEYLILHFLPLIIVYLMFFDANNLILEFKFTNTNILYKWYPKQLMSISPPLRYNSSPMIRPRIFPIVYFELSEWICSSFLFNCGKHIFFANSRFYISKFRTNTSGNFNSLQLHKYFVWYIFFLIDN